MHRRDSSIFLEYQRMREEKEIKNIHDNIPMVRSMFDIPGITNVMPTPKADMTSGGDIIDGVPVIPVRRHGARLCMISAMIHMKNLASRKPKTIQELRKNPLTTHEESELNNVHDSDKDSDKDSYEGTERDIFANVRKCRYLRGVNDEQELSIEDIFH